MPFPGEMTYTATELRSSAKKILDCVDDNGVASLVSRSRDPMVIIKESDYVYLLFLKHQLENKSSL